MKYLNTVLLIVIAIALAANFYLDHQRDLAYRAKLETAIAAPTKDAEPSPFDKTPSNQLQSPQKHKYK